MLRVNAARALGLLLLSLCAAGAGAVDDLWVANDTVRAAVTDADHAMLYIGGDFTYVGPATGSGVGVDAVSGELPTDPDPAFPRVNGAVYAAVSDGSGGWYIGGAFSQVSDQVGDHARANLAYIDSSNTVGSWAPDPDGAVRALALDTANILVYVGGDFTCFGDASPCGSGTPRNHIAALSTAGAGSATAWDPDADDAVRALVLDTANNLVYVGGDFTCFGDASPCGSGTPRNHIAALSTAGAGSATAWDPDADSVVHALVLDTTNNLVYAGGDFSNIGGQTRNHISALSTAGAGSATAWDPNADDVVRALALDGTTLYVGGDFTCFGDVPPCGSGTLRNRIAALSTADGSSDPDWDPDANGAVRALVLDGTMLYAGGDFTAMDSAARHHLAAFDTAAMSPDLPTDWDPRAGAAVHALAFDSANNVVYAGGDFTSVGGELRDRLAALDLATGEATAWDPGADDIVRTLLLSVDEETLYVGGDFTGVGGQVRNRVAALSTSTGVGTPWNPNADGSVYAMEPSVSGASFYVAGQFTVIGGQPRLWAAEVRTFNGTATTWSPFDAAQDAMVGNGAYDLALNGDILYLGGEFTSIGGELRDQVAAYDLAADELLAWAPQINGGVVRALQFSPDASRLYAGGNFTEVPGGTPHRGIVALDPAGDDPFNWNPQLDGSVFAITPSLDRTLLYVGGDFTSIGPQARNRLAALDPVTGSADPVWVVSADDTVNALHAFNDPDTDEFFLYAGGAFSTIDGASRGRLARLDALPPENQLPVTTATPAGGIYNDENNDPVVLSCSDSGGSGCAATYYTTDATDPTTDSDLYESPIALEEDMELRFFSVDHAGNEEVFQTETYVVEADDPMTTASPSTRVFEGDELRVQLSCNDGDGEGCIATYYTTDGSLPTTASSQATGWPFTVTITDTTVIRFFSVDGAGNIESVRREEYVSNRGEIGALSAFELGAGVLVWSLAAAGRRRRR